MTSNYVVRRVPVTFPHRGAVMVGTLHLPSSAVATRERVALVLLNAGPAPRAGNSDLSAHLADRVAMQGVFGFRFDLPGLGDSTGTTWHDIEAFWQASQHGFNDEAVVTTVHDLCERYELRGVMLGGLCAGAISSVRVAEALGERLLGLVLLEPNFRASADVNSSTSETAVDVARASMLAPSRIDRLRKKLSRLSDIDELLYLLTGNSRYARVLRPIRPFLERVIERHLGRELPYDVLMDAVSTWRRLVNAGVPSLLVVASGLGTDRYMERITRTFLPTEVDIVRTVLIPDSNHILTAGEARRQTENALVAWVADRLQSTPRLATVSTPAHRSTPSGAAALPRS